ncbi:MAG TPA: ABC transporter permease [Phycisphaerae bacterium]|nr:ABC transporter permease [Phycisphaerae bacterium]
MIHTLKHFLLFLRGLHEDRRVIAQLTRRDFQTRYLGSYLGLVWAFVQPAVTIAIFWFVFEVGLRQRGVSGEPFVLFLVSGLIPWFFFADALSGATTAVLQNDFLVKNVVFRVSVLPIVRVLCALFIHAFFLCVLVGLFALYGRWPDAYSLQVLYYSAGAAVLLLGLGWGLSAVGPFVRDLPHLVNVVVQLGFWLTPIVWNFEFVERKSRLIATLLKLNPMFYVVRGYRDALVTKVWFWQHPWGTAYFWCVTGAVFVLGATVFRRLRPHFADVL